MREPPSPQECILTIVRKTKKLRILIVGFLQVRVMIKGGGTNRVPKGLAILFLDLDGGYT